ncbi:MAG TPA: hypothetical protein VGV67_09610 [Solirubrobacteraceae bacterium]|nr:hypothetical protein [Solirubrobacteraceae bacterium]
MTTALAALIACSVLAACGGDDDARTTTASSPPGTVSGLGPERYRALERVYLAERRIDELPDDAPPAEFERASGPFVAACNALDEDDPLLGPLRRTCPVLTRFTEQLLEVSACARDGLDACGDLLAGVRRTLRDFTRLSRRSDRAIADSRLSPACKRALATPALAYEAIDGFQRAFALLARGAAAEADEALAAADAQADRLPSAEAELERFRSGCG